MWKLLGPHLKSGHPGNWLSQVDVSKLEPIKGLTERDLINLGINYEQVMVIKNVCETFVRVSPIVLLSVCLQKLMTQKKLVQKSEKIAQPLLFQSLLEMPSMLSWAEFHTNKKIC